MLKVSKISFLIALVLIPTGILLINDPVKNYLPLLAGALFTAYAILYFMSNHKVSKEIITKNEELLKENNVNYRERDGVYHINLENLFNKKELLSTLVVNGEYRIKLTRSYFVLMMLSFLLTGASAILTIVIQW